VEFDVVVEVPKGGRNKYEMDHGLGRIRLDRTLFTATAYPADYGFIEHTLARDGQPLDAVVLVEQPTFPGCLIRCRPIGLFRMVDEDGPDDKVICVPVGDARLEHLRDIIHLPEYHKLEIQHFFEVYKQVEPGKKVVGDTSWAGRAAAETEITEARRRTGS
jgi:inorganic pyrophosphatase